MYFKDIIGQAEVKRRLIDSLNAGYLPHARLIYGNPGVGSFQLALAYARYIHCTDKQADDACGNCPSCHKIDKLSHPDLHFVFPIVKGEKKKETCDDYLPEWRTFLQENPYFDFDSWLSYIHAENKQAVIYTKEGDEIIKKMNLKAYESEYKITIIWLPEKMNVECSNKLLKLIEEPPEKTVFLLVSEVPDNVIETIRSRSQNLYIPPISEQDLGNQLSRQFSMLLEDLYSVVHLADGSYLKALRAMETSAENEEFLELFITIMRNSWTRNVKNMKAKADYFHSFGRERQKAFLSYAQRLVRENFLSCLQLPEINYMNKGEADFSVKFSPYINERNVIDFMDQLALAESHIEHNVNAKMVFFDLSMKIAVLLKR